MIKQVIGTSSINEIYEVTAAIKRGALVTKNLSTGKAVAASDTGVDVWIVDADNQPTGHLSDVEISQYDESLDTISAGSRAVLKKYPVGAQIASDQVVTTGLTAGDYAVAGTSGNAGKFVKATTGKTSIFKYLGTYDDAGHTLYNFEIVNPVTLS
ncbi:hypothetical protein [Paenibacillus xylaniclasticus]|uniref:hypothetical protein n=1 Tax=Paenibacillus xylaniclasticus TaxID=588083 RepID=UPI000FD8BE09|nr:MULTISPECIES: hypothetical protein [Paenibacillus]GFN32593.1 hypothetical protein PCURB6_28530 [Paenibacillus curdlanolyticus]